MNLNVTKFTDNQAATGIANLASTLSHTTDTLGKTANSLKGEKDEHSKDNSMAISAVAEANSYIDDANTYATSVNGAVSAADAAKDNASSAITNAQDALKYNAQSTTTSKVN